MKDWWNRSLGFAAEVELRGHDEALRRAQMAQQTAAQRQREQYAAMMNYVPRYERGLAQQAEQKQWELNIRYWLGDQWVTRSEWEDPDLFIDVGL